MYSLSFLICHIPSCSITYSPSSVSSSLSCSLIFSSSLLLTLSPPHIFIIFNHALSVPNSDSGSCPLCLSDQVLCRAVTVVTANSGNSRHRRLLSCYSHRKLCYSGQHLQPRYQNPSVHLQVLKPDTVRYVTVADTVVAVIFSFLHHIKVLKISTRHQTPFTSSQ